MKTEKNESKTTKQYKIEKNQTNISGQTSKINLNILLI